MPPNRMVNPAANRASRPPTSSASTTTAASTSLMSFQAVCSCAFETASATTRICRLFNAVFERWELTPKAHRLLNLAQIAAPHDGFEIVLVDDDDHAPAFRRKHGQVHVARLDRIVVARHRRRLRGQSQPGKRPVLIGRVDLVAL